MSNFDFDKATKEMDEILNEKTRQYLVREGFPSDPASVVLARSVIEKQILENIPKVVDMFYEQSPVQKYIMEKNKEQK